MDNSPKSASSGGTVLLLVLGAGVLCIAIRYWFVVIPIVLIAGAIWWYLAIRKEQEKAAAEAALRVEAAEQARQAELAIAQLRHHIDALSAADPVYSDLMVELKDVPPTRPADRARVEKGMADRLVVINQFAGQFAELERTVQAVPDHGETMRGLVKQERAWDARSQSVRAKPARRPRGIAHPQRGTI